MWGYCVPMFIHCEEGRHKWSSAESFAPARTSQIVTVNWSPTLVPYQQMQSLAFLSSKGKHVLLVDPLPSSCVSPLCVLAIHKANAKGTVGPVAMSKKCTFTRCKLVLWFGLSPYHTPQVCGLKELPLSYNSFAVVSFLVHQPFWTRILSLIFNRNWID